LHTKQSINDPLCSTQLHGPSSSPTWGHWSIRPSKPSTPNT
jgi:hypothetical protein